MYYSTINSPLITVAIAAFVILHVILAQTTLALAVSNNIVFVDDVGYLESYVYNQSIMERATTTETKVFVKTGRDMFYEIFSKFESYKTDRALWTTTQQGRRTLTKMKYLICPVWFADEVEKPADITLMGSIMQRNKEFYERMSWNQHEVTWEFVPDLKFVNLTTTNNPTRDQGSKECLQYINTLGKQYPTTQTGLIVAYNPIQAGDYSFRGGVAVINYNITWMSIPFDFSVTRHELGHNYGHPHHSAYSYDWRLTRGMSTNVQDGYDMMSGGKHDTRFHCD
jgi:hypothetical protein